MTARTLARNFGLYPLRHYGRVSYVIGYRYPVSARTATKRNEKLKGQAWPSAMDDGQPTGENNCRHTGTPRVVCLDDVLCVHHGQRDRKDMRSFEPDRRAIFEICFGLFLMIGFNVNVV